MKLIPVEIRAQILAACLSLFRQPSSLAEQRSPAQRAVIQSRGDCDLSCLFTSRS